MREQLREKIRTVWAILFLASKKFLQIDGTKWAEAFAFNAFFSLFPLIILLVTVVSSVVGSDRAAKEIIGYLESYVPISGKMQSYIFDTVAGVIKARGQAGLIASLMLVWTTFQCFSTLTNRQNERRARHATTRCQPEKERVPLLHSMRATERYVVPLKAARTKWKLKNHVTPSGTYWNA